MNKVISRVKNGVTSLLRRKTWDYNPWQAAQDGFMRSCLTSPNVKLRGVLHVGGHLGEEYPIYKEAGAKKVVFFEPMQEVFKELTKRLGGREDVVLVKKALGAKSETREIHINRGSGESTSFLKPTALYDGYFEERTRMTEIVTLDSFLATVSDGEIFNTLVTDTQGFDLEVLKGAMTTLKQIDYVYTEVSRGHYHGEPTLDDFDTFLKPMGFRRAETSMYGSWKGADQWGDMLYVKDGQGA